MESCWILRVVYVFNLVKLGTGLLWQKSLFKHELETAFYNKYSLSTAELQESCTHLFYHLSLF